jgi:hypothetical protein
VALLALQEMRVHVHRKGSGGVAEPSRHRIHVSTVAQPLRGGGVPQAADRGSFARCIPPIGVGSAGRLRRSLATAGRDAINAFIETEAEQLQHVAALLASHEARKWSG